MTITLESPNRSVLLVTDNEDYIQYFIKWLDYYHRYKTQTFSDDNRLYTFSKDSEVVASTVKARRIGWITC